MSDLSKTPFPNPIFHYPVESKHGESLVENKNLFLEKMRMFEVKESEEFKMFNNDVLDKVISQSCTRCYWDFTLVIN